MRTIFSFGITYLLLVPELFAQQNSNKENLFKSDSIKPVPYSFIPDYQQHNYNMPVYKPDTTTNDKIATLIPDTTQGFSMIIMNPDNGQKYDYRGFERSKRVTPKPS